MFLSQAEIIELTGYERTAWQRKWLDMHSIPYTERSNGKLNVFRSAVECRHNAAPIKQAEPDFTFLLKRA